MKLSDGEKLILIMLADLHKKMGVKGEIDPGFVQSAIFSDNLWGFNWQYGGLFGNGGEGNPRIVREVVDYLDMWSCIEISWSRFSKVEKEKIAVDAAPFGTSVTFPGFDGNNEGEYMNVCRFMVDDLKRFPSFKRHGDSNSHSPKDAAIVMLTKHPAETEGEGTIAASVRRLNSEEGAKLAREIVGLYVSLRDR